MFKDDGTNSFWNFLKISGFGTGFLVVGGLLLLAGLAKHMGLF